MLLYVNRVCHPEIFLFMEDFLESNMFYWFLIQNMEMVPVPSQGFGNFFEGDCYIVLNVSIHISEGV